MGEWKEYKLGDILSLVTKGTTPPKGVGFVDKGINYVKSDAIGYNRRLDKTKLVQIDDETHEKFKRSQLAEDDILFSMAGVYLGKNAIVPKDILPANTNQALAILRINQKKALSNYVSLYLSQQSVIEYVNNMSGQSAQPNINFEEIKSIEVLLPSLPEQCAIASVLSSLDDKIDLLHCQNATLEKMAETLFRQWFVEEAKEEWEMGIVLDLFKLQRGFDLPIQNRISGKYPVITSSGINGTHNEFKVKRPGVTTGRSGVIGNVYYIDEDFWPLNTSLFILEYYRATPLFAYHFLKMLDLASLNGGSAVPTLNRNDVHQLDTELPPIEFIKVFEKEVKPYFEKIKNNQSQIRTLTQIRDTLLPKLMSGEVRVKM